MSAASKPPFAGEVRRVRLGELLADSFSGEWGSEDGESVTAILRTANFNPDGSLDYSSPAYRCVPSKKVEMKALKRGDVLIEKSGGTPKRPVGIVALFDSEMRAVCSNFNHVLRFDSCMIDPRFAFHQLRWLHSKGAFERYTRKTTGLQNLEMRKFFDLPLTVPEPGIQRFYVNGFNMIEEIKKTGVRQLALLDDLVKSRFVEMFGDPRSNDRGWMVRPLGEVCSTRLGKMLDVKKQDGKNQRPYLANTDVQWFSFNLNNLRTMDFDESDREEFALREGDVLATEGGEVGRCAIWHGELEECYFQKAVHRIRCNGDCLVPEFLAWTFKMKSEHGLFDPYVSRSTIAHLTGKKIKQIPVQLPPLSLQREFAAFAAERVAKSQVVAQRFLWAPFKLRKPLS